jgi:GTP cyclohydrolase I
MSSVRVLPEQDELVSLISRQLQLLGEDPQRPGLVDTPSRVARALRFLTEGYDVDPISVIGEAIFRQEYDEMVLVRNIQLYSLCEHHLLPFFGQCHVAYLPDGKVVGLSKIPRLVDAFAHRLQIQEALTTQIAEALDDVLHPRGVAVVVEARHLCMEMRGVERVNSATVTSCMLGAFRNDPRTRSEFLNLIRREG